jgi:hypothetical protein
MSIALIFNTAHPGTTGWYVERAFRNAGIPCASWSPDQLDQVPEQFDLYLWVDHGDNYERPWPDRLRPAILYAIDTHLKHSWPKIRRAALQYDMVVCGQREGAVRLGAGWLPLACDAELHGGALAERDTDIAFVGTDGGVPRKFYLQALRERYSSHRIGPADYRRIGERYGRARIAFNYAIARDVNMRVFEALAGGALLLTNALPHDDLRRIGLERGAHYAEYASPEDLFARADYYLEHPEERQRIAEAGRREALARHTYRHRMKQLLGMVRERLGVDLFEEQGAGGGEPGTVLAPRPAPRAPS